jgi:hypothetical protein
VQPAVQDGSSQHLVGGSSTRGCVRLSDVKAATQTPSNLSIYPTAARESLEIP